MKLNTPGFVATLLLALLHALPLQASPLRQAVDLHADGQAADREKIPLVILFSRTDCPFCKTMRDLYLEPMQDDAKYCDRMLVREVNLDRGDQLVDFGGNKISAKKFAREWKIGLTPTLVFLDGKGNPTVKDIVGLGNASYFSYYLEQAVDNSVNKLRATD